MRNHSTHISPIHNAYLISPLSMSLEMEGALLGMGNPLLDISATVPMDFLAKYDLQLNNGIIAHYSPIIIPPYIMALLSIAVLAEEKHNNIFNDMIATFPVQYIAGGATQNVRTVVPFTPLLIQSQDSWT